VWTLGRGKEYFIPAGTQTATPRRPARKPFCLLSCLLSVVTIFSEDREKFVAKFDK
jgi:hypothetical protein